MRSDRVRLATVPSQPDCTCDDCQSACLRRPGWLIPADAKRIADHLGVTVAELFRTRLAVDWWEADEDAEETFVLAPALRGEKAGAEYPGNPNGACVFFESGRCSIHSVKPWECRVAGHVNTDVATAPRAHAAARDAWRNKKAQAMVRRLLGRKPVTDEYHANDLRRAAQGPAVTRPAPKDPDMDLRPALAASCAIADLKRFAREAAPTMEREPADEIRQCLSVLALEIDHPHPDKDAMRMAVQRITIACEQIERGKP